MVFWLSCKIIFSHSHRTPFTCNSCSPNFDCKIIYSWKLFNNIHLHHFYQHFKCNLGILISLTAFSWMEWWKLFCLYGSLVVYGINEILKRFWITSYHIINICRLYLWIIIYLNILFVIFLNSWYNFLNVNCSNNKLIDGFDEYYEHGIVNIDVINIVNNLMNLIVIWMSIKQLL